MSTRRKDDSREAFDYDRAYQELAQSLSTLHLTRTDEMPRIELYRDQVLSIIRNELTPLYGEDEKIVTGSMINNYVKQRLVPAPLHKRYTRRHLAYLLLVCTLKRILPIAQLEELFRLCHESDIDLLSAYDESARVVECMLRAHFAPTSDAPREAIVGVRLYNHEGEPVGGKLVSLVNCAIGLVVDKVYLENMLALEARNTPPILHEEVSA